MIQSKISIGNFVTQNIRTYVIRKNGVPKFQLLREISFLVRLEKSFITTKESTDPLGNPITDHIRISIEQLELFIIATSVLAELERDVLLNGKDLVKMLAISSNDIRQSWRTKLIVRQSSLCSGPVGKFDTVVLVYKRMFSPRPIVSVGKRK